MLEWAMVPGKASCQFDVVVCSVTIHSQVVFARCCTDSAACTLTDNLISRPVKEQATIHTLRLRCRAKACSAEYTGCIWLHLTNATPDLLCLHTQHCWLPRIGHSRLSDIWGSPHIWAVVDACDLTCKRNHYHLCFTPYCTILNPGSPGGTQYDEKNIRRRVYDALNVLIAMEIISRSKKEILWHGLPSGHGNALERARADKICLSAQIDKQQNYLQVEWAVASRASICLTCLVCVL